MRNSTGTPMHGIAEVARAAGVSSRTLRHYGQIGLLVPTETGAGGLRRYDDAAVVRLQRILLLRGLGVGLDEVRRVLDGERDDVTALTTHLGWLEQERDRIARQLAAVRTTIRTLQEGRPMDTERAFDGFDSGRYRAEVEERWGRDARQRGDDWWGALDTDEKAAFRAEQTAIAEAAAVLAETPDDPAAPDDTAALALARRQWAWLLRSTPDLDADRFRAIADMYVDDDRFAAAYGGAVPARALRDAMHALADRGGVD